MTYLNLDGWAGRNRVPVEVVEETPKRYRVKLGESCSLPSRRSGRAGDVVLVPKYAITGYTPPPAAPGHQEGEKDAD